MSSVIVAPAWLGDAVMAQALVQRLRERWPDEAVHWFAPPSTAPLGERLPGVEATHLLPVGHGEVGLRRRWRAGRALRDLDLRRAFVLPGSFKAALTPAFAGIGARIGYRKEARALLLTEARTLDARALPRMVDRMVALADPSGAPSAPRAPVLRADAERAAALRSALELVPEHATPVRVLALCPGAAFGSSKRWPTEHFSTLALRAIERGDAVWLFGGPGDVDVTARIRTALPADAPVHDLAGRTQLVDAIDLLALADAVVSNDSGLMHVAAALGKPVVALYGSTTPAFTPPLSNSATVLERELDCRPCFARECPLGHRDCLRGLAPQAVDDAVQALRSAVA